MNTLNKPSMEEDNTIMEVKESFMLSPSSVNANVAAKEPTLRNAHFLKPLLSNEQLNQPPPPPSSSSSGFQPNQLKIQFTGWRYPHRKWVDWVDQLQPKYESVWKKAGIFEPIMSTKSHILKSHDLVYEAIEKWCSQTNTFVFPFGEATITLEDVMVLGGYSLFGDPVSIQLQGTEMRKIELKLIIARNRLYETTTNAPRVSLWMDIFINSKGNEIEHEAFIVTWLSIFVFPDKSLWVKTSLFPIAVHLARGKPIALAPAVLASLYRDLRLFKEKIVNSKICSLEGVQFPIKVEVNVQSPIYLVQVWVWERFKNLQPKPKLIKNGDPLLSRWKMVKPLKVDSVTVRLALDSAKDDFLWRPYVQHADKCEMFYPDDGILVPLEKDLDIGLKKQKKDLDKNILSFVISLRVSELVGFESVEQYLPHRVAMQFGMDQDVPACVPRFNENETIAWKNYCRPLSDASLFIPSRFFDAGVTTRYATWWKRSASSSSCTADAEIPLEFPPPKLVTFGKSCDYSSKAKKGDDIVDGDVEDGLNSEKNSVDIVTGSDNSVEDGLNAEKNMAVDGRSPLLSVAEDGNHVLEDVQSKDADESMEARISSDDVCQAETQTERYSYLSEASIADLDERISRLEIAHTKLKTARQRRRRLLR